jgi:hypothetical protein
MCCFERHTMIIIHFILDLKILKQTQWLLPRTTFYSSQGILRFIAVIAVPSLVPAVIIGAVAATAPVGNTAAAVAALSYTQPYLISHTARFLNSVILSCVTAAT